MEYITADAALNYAVRDQWGSGFVADLELDVDQAVNGWRISFELDADIDNIWNARIVSRVGNVYTIESLSYNAELPAGGTAGFGFTASGTDTAIDPASVAINGQPAGDGGGDPQPVLPTVAVGDLVASEEGGTAQVPVTLSAASDQDVILHYESYDLTATAGQDYVPVSGQLVIPAGQLTASIALDLIDDALVDGGESLGLRLTAVQGATIADAEALVTISDADTAPPVLPHASIADIQVVEGNPVDGGGGGGTGGGATGQFADGPLSTAGNQIVDANGAPVEIRAVNWFGFETQNNVRTASGPATGRT